MEVTPLVSEAAPIAHKWLNFFTYTHHYQDGYEVFWRNFTTITVDAAGNFSGESHENADNLGAPQPEPMHDVYGSVLKTGGVYRMKFYEWGAESNGFAFLNNGYFICILLQTDKGLSRVYSFYEPNS